MGVGRGQQRGIAGAHRGALHEVVHHVRLFLFRCEDALGEVGMRECFGSRDSFPWRLLEHPGEQVHGLGVDGLVLLPFEGDVAGPVLRQHLVVSLARECADS